MKMTQKPWTAAASPRNFTFVLQIEEYETHQELWRESINSLSDQFEFLWQEIQAEEKQCKKKEDEEDEEEEEQLLKELEACVSFSEANKRCLHYSSFFYALI